ncbi:unnamed protein product [Brassica napus]|uniref:non-specific serine/threonine protein kinase n=1 Tax=Brassica napus TaxID=3708 RepID=A0A816J2Q7_BRANA|nr:unnamed protein product [Brassica napus]
MEIIDKWVAEFLIRCQHNPRVSPTNLLSALRFGDSGDCLKLKVSSVLLDLSDSLTRGSVDEGTLDLLEILEKLLLQQCSVITESHKSAYCWTAAECTLRFMWPLDPLDGLFTDALERIWTKRIGFLKESGSGLVSDELLKWEADLKKAVEDPEMYQRIRESNIRYTAISFLNQLLKEQWGLLGSSSLESVAQRRFRKRKAENNVEGDGVRSREGPNGVDERTGRMESDNLDNSNENGDNRDAEGVGCPENDGIDKVNEQLAAEEEGTMGSQEQKHESSPDKGDKMAARELKDYLLEIQRQIDPSTRQVQEPNDAFDHSVNVTPQPSRVNRTGTSGQDHIETPDNASEKGSSSQGTWSGRVRPRLSSPVPLNVSPLKKTNSPVRRPKKFWTPEEVEALRAGVKEYGKSWKDIKNANPAVFAERTEFWSTMNMNQVSEYVETDPTGRYGRFAEVLGRGAMKTVYKAIDEMLGIEVAWSQVKLKEVLRSSVDLQRLYSEVHLLSTLNHKSIIRFYTSWIDVHSHTLNFITELFTSGTLRQYKNKYLRIDIRAIKSWARQILEGLVYLHGHDPPVIHRDLKCDNIFVNGHLGQVKIGDLGLARMLRDCHAATSVIGTPEFMAPELYEENYNELIDVYSFGMCFLEMITSEFPYSECNNPAQIYKKVVAGKLPGAFYRVEDIEAQRFIGKCLVPASKRVSARELLQDPFLASDESWMVYASGARNLKPFLNENEMDRLKLEEDETGEVDFEDNKIYLKLPIANENGLAKNVSFCFDIMNDTSIDVATEMVKELEITEWDPVEIAKMIDGEISSLVPGWGSEEDDESPHDYHTPFHSSSSPSSSRASLSNYMAPGRQDWLQDDETYSQSSSNSGSYSNLNYISVDEHISSQPTAMNRTHNVTRFCPEESYHLHSGQASIYAASSSSSNSRLASDNRVLTRNRSLVDVHRSLVEEARKRRLIKTVGDVENVGFQSPYAVSRKPRSSRR